MVYHPVPRVVPCHALPFRNFPCRSVPCLAIMLWCAVLCYAMLCCTVLCCILNSREYTCAGACVRESSDDLKTDTASWDPGYLAGKKKKTPFIQPFEMYQSTRVQDFRVSTRTNGANNRPCVRGSIQMYAEPPSDLIIVSYRRLPCALELKSTGWDQDFEIRNEALHEPSLTYSTSRRVEIEWGQFCILCPGGGGGILLWVFTLNYSVAGWFYT